jgi:hypothetical protein
MACHVYRVHERAPSGWLFDSVKGGGDGEAGGKMTLAGAGFTHQQNWFGALQIAALG